MCFVTETIKNVVFRDQIGIFGIIVTTLNFPFPPCSRHDHKSPFSAKSGSYLSIPLKTA